jgi:hypothetical protein
MNRQTKLAIIGLGVMVLMLLGVAVLMLFFPAFGAKMSRLRAFCRPLPPRGE